MKKKILLFLLIVCFSTYAQDRFEVKAIGFSMDSPRDWIKLENKEALENLENYDFTDEQKNKLLKSNNSRIDLVTYSKYDSSKHYGIIPTIKVRTHNDDSKTIKDFLQVIENSNKEVSKTLNNFEYKDKPEVITISENKVVRFATKFTLKNDGKDFTIVCYSYYILKDGYFISLNFIEEFEKENNLDFFQNIINTIKLN